MLPFGTGTPSLLKNKAEISIDLVARIEAAADLTWFI